MDPVSDNKHKIPFFEFTVIVLIEIGIKLDLAAQMSLPWLYIKISFVNVPKTILKLVDVFKSKLHEISPSTLFVSYMTPSPPTIQ